MTYVYFHSNDLDGHASGAITRMALENRGEEVVMRPFDYGDIFPWDQVKAMTLITLWT